MLDKNPCWKKWFFVTSLGTKLSTTQMLRLQGVPPARLKRPEDVSERQFDQAIGNAITVPLLSALIRQMTVAVGFIDKDA